jgi:hypothetical protein
MFSGGFEKWMYIVRRREMKKSILLSLTILAILLFSAQKAQAQLITIAITATVDHVEDWGAGNGYLDGKIHIGDTVTGTYTYESTTLDLNPDDPTVGNYVITAANNGITLTVGGFIFKTDPTNVQLELGVTYKSFNCLGFYSHNNIPLSNGTSVYDISWRLFDKTGTALTSDVLPVTAPDLSEWQSEYFRMDGPADTPGTGYAVWGPITSMKLIPEPTTIILLGLGILSLRKRK